MRGKANESHEGKALEMDDGHATDLGGESRMSVRLGPLEFDPFARSFISINSPRTSENRAQPARAIDGLPRKSMKTSGQFVAEMTAARPKKPSAPPQKGATLPRMDGEPNRPYALIRLPESAMKTPAQKAIYELRIRRNWTVRAIALAVGVAPSTVHDWQAGGNIRPQFLAQLVNLARKKA